MIKAIRRQGGQASVLDMASGREVIERLKHRVVESHYLMDRVIKKAADSRGTDSSRLRLKIKHLADHSRLPEKSPVKPRSMPSQACFEFRDHPQGKRTIAGDILTATDLGGHTPKNGQSGNSVDAGG